MLTRREALQYAGFGMALFLAQRGEAAQETGVELNDVQCQLNKTRVNRVIQPASLDEISAALRAASGENRAVSVAGGRHAMGGQQFGEDNVHLDLKQLRKVLSLDRVNGRVTVEAGIEWPELIDYLHREQPGSDVWTIRQKQTGVDKVTLAGTLSANAHARGLRFKPMIEDVESFVLVGADGQPKTCSRTENSELFRLAIGGYGLFGVIAQVTLRLVKRAKVERIVKVIPIRTLVDAVEERVREGFLYGDCQYSTDITGENPDHPAVFSCYRPVSADREAPAQQKKLSQEDWARLYLLARTNKKKAFEAYSNYYLSTSGQVYWSDTHQMAGIFDIENLQETLVRKRPDGPRGSEMITEVYVTPDKLLDFLRDARKDILEHQIDLTYGTIRFIEKDDESFLAWAKERSICILCNLHVVHTPAGQEKAIADLRRLIGRAVQHGGRYYLTYHRWATREQVLAGYPQFVDFLKLKQKYDPQERFQSTWYRHYRTMFADQLS